jgi:hypothetical protein
MQRLVQSRASVNGQPFGINLRGDPGLRAKVIEVCRKAIAQIDGCAGDIPPAQPNPLGNSRMRPEVRPESVPPLLGISRIRSYPPRTLSQQFQPQRRSAKSARDAHDIPRSGTRAQQSPPARHGSQKDNVGKGQWRFCEVSPRERRLKLVRKGKESIYIPVDPGPTPSLWRSQGLW